MSLLSYGSTGDSVKTLQQNLNTVGNYGLADDGIYGEKTKAAVTDYQKKNGLGVDGIVGDETSGSLAKALAAKTAAATKPATTTSTATKAASTAVSADPMKPSAASTPSLSYAEDMTPQLDQWLENAKAQQNQAIDYGVNKSVKELQRAEEDAQEQFQTQRNQITADEAKALSNQALYAEARGDKGGIGQEQYNSIMNTAMQNLQTVNKTQVKLATDTARQIEDLRAQGDFEKADAMLSLTQEYLGKLMELKQWAMSYNMSVDQFNAQMSQWRDEFNRSSAQWQIEFDYAKNQDAQKTLSSAGQALLSAGVMPSASQLSAMGMTKSEAQSYISALTLSSNSGSGGGSSSSSGSGKSSSKSSSKPSGGGYDNGGLSTEQIKALQRAIGADPDGLYGSQSKAAAGGLSAKEAYNKYVGGSSKSSGSSAQVAYNNSVGKAAASNYDTALSRAQSYKKAGAAKGRTEALLLQYVENGSITTSQAKQILSKLY